MMAPRRRVGRSATRKQSRANSFDQPDRDRSGGLPAAYRSEALSAVRAGLHAEDKAIAVEVDHVKVAHAIIVMLRRLDHLCSAFEKFRVNRVDIPHEHADSAVARQPRGLSRCEQMHGDFVAGQARIERRLPVLKGDLESERLTVIRDALGYV